VAGEEEEEVDEEDDADANNAGGEGWFQSSKPCRRPTATALAEWLDSM
jgi:hypothetical protein